MFTAPSPRTELKRARARGSHDPAVIRQILDAAFLCHLAVSLDGTPVLVPTVCVRRGDELFVHGSTANRVLRALRDGAEACVSVCHVDGLILARSAFHHSVNYRSVVIYGLAREVVEPSEKDELLRAFIDHVTPGRWETVRAPSREELLRTLVLGIPIAEASAKVRNQPPIDDAEDHALDCWAGTLPLRTVADDPVPCPRLKAGIPVPAHVGGYARPWARRPDPA